MRQREAAVSVVDLWNEAREQLKLLAVGLWLWTKYWPTFRVLPLARLLNNSWSSAIRRYSIDSGGSTESTVLTIRRVAVQSATHNKWIFRAVALTVSVALGLGIFFAVPFLAAAMFDARLSSPITIGVGFVAFILWMLLTLIFESVARIPPLSFVPLLGGIMQLCVALLVAWWLIDGGGAALLESLAAEAGMPKGEKLQFIAAVNALAVALALYTFCANMVDLAWQIAGSRSPGEVLSRRVNGYPPPAHIVVESYLRLIILIENHRSDLRKRAIKKMLVSAVRYSRIGMLAEIDRCIKSYGGSVEDRNLYRNRVEVFSCRLKEHERKLLDSFAPSEVDSLLQEMASDVESLCSGGWQEASDRNRLDLKQRLFGLIRRIIPAAFLVTIGLLYPQLPTVDPNGAGVGAVQAAIISMAIPLLFASELPLDGKAANLLGRRGRDRSERD